MAKNKLDPLPDYVVDFRPCLRMQNHKWVFSFHYSDFSYIVEIDHAYGDCGTWELFLMDMGDKIPAVTETQLFKLQEQAREHGDVFNADSVWIIPTSHVQAVINRVDICLARWNALQILVSPSVSL